MAIKQFLRKKLADPNQLSLLDAFFSDGSLNSANSPQPNAIAPDPAIPPNHRRLHFGTHFLDYRLLRSRRRSVGFLIDDDGLRVTAPQWLTMMDIEAAISAKQAWIFKKINEQRERSVRRLRPPMEWRDGAKLPLMAPSVRGLMKTNANCISVCLARQLSNNSKIAFRVGCKAKPSAYLPIVSPSTQKNSVYSSPASLFLRPVRNGDPVLPMVAYDLTGA